MRSAKRRRSASCRRAPLFRCGRLYSRTPRIANIFVEKHLGRARELFKYIDTIRSIVRFGGYNWRAYDVQFRLRQARQPHRSWAAIDTELWLTVATAQPRGGFHAGGHPHALPFRGGGGGGQGSGVPATIEQSFHAGPTPSPAGGRRAGAGFNRARANHCFAFNAGTCQRGACRFAHVCANCGSASHAAVACTRGAKGDNSAPPQLGLIACSSFCATMVIGMQPFALQTGFVLVLVWGLKGTGWWSRLGT